MARLRDWWQRLTGRPAGLQDAAPPARAHGGVTAADPPRGLPVDSLELADAAPARKPSRVAEAGFDPYSSDAGYAKPHSWERVDHD